jgi:hypothetical protein
MSVPLQPPVSYADWMTCFQFLIRGDRDEDLLEVIAKGKVPWTKGIAERFVKKMSDAISERLNLAVEDFIKQLGRANGEENAIVQAILALRRRGQYLLRWVSTPVFPEDVRAKFTEEIENSLSQLQDILINEVKRDPSGRLNRVVQHTPILVSEQPSIQETPVQKEKTKRRIIFE